LVELYIKYGKVVKDEEQLLRRREFPNGERFHGRPWPNSAEIRAAVELAEKRKQEYRREQAAEENQKWFENYIKEAPHGPEKERRQKEFRQWQNARDAEAFASIASAICEKYKITREEFEAHAEQYEFENSIQENPESEWPY
jgi:hypothetical protein